MEVPVNSMPTVPPPDLTERMELPGAAMSGFKDPDWSAGPREELSFT